MKEKLVCSACGQVSAPEALRGRAMRCVHCGGILDVQYDAVDPEARRRELSADAAEPSGVWRYASFLPESRNRLTLDEGNTPLTSCAALARRVGVAELTVKNEGLNPSGSYKDRGVAVSVSKALDDGYACVSLGSAGNAGSAAAAYSAHGAIPCVLLLPDGAVPERVKLAGLYGARVIRVRGSIDDCIRLSARLQERFGWCNVSTARPYNPYGVEGYKTLAYELCRQFRFDLPQWIAVPLGGGSLISKIWDGLQEVYALGMLRSLPRLVGVQASGCAPYVRHFETGAPPVKWEHPDTIAFSIADVWPFDWEFVDKALAQSNGLACCVDDRAIVEAQQDLASLHAVLAEPSSAATVAAVRALRASGVIGGDDRVCCVISGSGMKDIGQLCGAVPMPEILPNDPDAVAEAVSAALDGSR